MKKTFLFVMAAFYVLAGINHFIDPSFYLKMIPDYLPLHTMAVYLSGVVEIVLGIALLFQQTRKLAALSIIFLLIAFLPVHIDMILHAENWDIPLWALVVRLPVQGLLILWAYVYTRS